MKERSLVSWSGGKDSAMALYETTKEDEYEILALLTTVTESYDRISMHGVRRTLVEEQVKSLGHQIEEVFIPEKASNEEYDSKMKEALKKYKNRGVRSVVFGDIFLEDVRKYREGNLKKVGMRGVFPLWKRDSLKLVQSFIDLGFRAVVTCVDSKVLDRGFTGRMVDYDLLADLPPGVDPSGENGEYHTFVFDGPIFSHAVPFSVGDVVLRDSFHYCDLLPEGDLGQ